MVETLSKNITRQGLTATTLNYLRVSNEAESNSGQVETLPPETASGIDQDSLPLPSADTLTGQSMSQNMPQNIDNLDFGSEPFQFQ